MKGIAASMLRLLYVSRLQRWLLGIGLPTMLLALGALAGGWHPDAQPLFRLAGILGVVTAFISPVVVGPLLFRSLCAPRIVTLIPHGRLKLFLGALCSQLLLAVIIGGCWALMNGYAELHPGSASESPLARAGTASAITFGGMTVFYMLFYCAMRSRLAAFIFLPFLLLPRLFSLPVAHQSLGAWALTPTGLGVEVGASLLVWTVFGLAVTRSGSVAAPSAAIHASSLRQRPAYTSREAIRTLLTGNVNMRRMIVLAVLFIGALALVTTLGSNGLRQNRPNLLMWAFMACLFASISAGMFGGTMVRRAKLLWLTAGKARAELFTEIEMQSWRLIFFAFGAAMLIALPLLAFADHAHPAVATLLAILALPLSSGAAVAYVGLLYVRGNRVSDILIVAANTIYVLVVTFVAASNSHLFPVVLGIQIISVALIRQVARERWNRLDWLLVRQRQGTGRV